MVTELRFLTVWTVSIKIPKLLYHHPSTGCVLQAFIQTTINEIWLKTILGRLRNVYDVLNHRSTVILCEWIHLINLIAIALTLSLASNVIYVYNIEWSDIYLRQFARSMLVIFILVWEISSCFHSLFKLTHKHFLIMIGFHDRMLDLYHFHPNCIHIFNFIHKGSVQQEAPYGIPHWTRWYIAGTWSNTMMGKSRHAG